MAIFQRDNSVISRGVKILIFACLFFISMANNALAGGALDFIREKFRNLENEGYSFKYENYLNPDYQISTSTVPTEPTLFLCHMLGYSFTHFSHSACGATAKASMMMIKEFYQLEKKTEADFKDLKNMILGNEIQRGSFLLQLTGECFENKGHAYVIEKVGPDEFNLYQSYIHRYTLLEFLENHKEFRNLDLKKITKHLEKISEIIDASDKEWSEATKTAWGELSLIGGQDFYARKRFGPIDFEGVAFF